MDDALYFFRTISKVAFGSLLATILVDFGWILEGFCMIFHEIWMHFCSKMCRSKSFYAIRFSLLHCYFLRSSFCMLPFFLQAACRIQSAIFQIYRKSQEHAEKFRNLQMASVSKNADIERRLTIYYLQNAVICTKAPSNKRGASGARAARRIRIRRPPWLGV